MDEAAPGTSFLETVHLDVFHTITKLVAANACKDFIFLAVTSKALKGRMLGEYEAIFLKSVEVVSLTELLEWSIGHVEFMRKCREAENLEAAFWLGLYFMLNDYNWVDARKCLWEVADSGHLMAKFAVGLFSIIHGERGSKVDLMLGEAQEELTLHQSSNFLIDFFSNREGAAYVGGNCKLRYETIKQYLRAECP